MRVNWGLTEALVTIGATLIVVVVAWGVSVEVRMAQHKTLENLSQRIENIEELMLPVLVDFKTRQELERRLEERGYRTAAPEPIPPCDREHVAHPPAPTMEAEAIVEEEQRIRAEEEIKAESWAKEAIERPQMQMAE